MECFIYIVPQMNDIIKHIWRYKHHVIALFAEQTKIFTGDNHIQMESESEKATVSHVCEYYKQK